MSIWLWKSLALLLGIVGGTLVSGAAMSGLVFAGLKLRLFLDPPNGNDFQYLDVYLLGSLVNGVILVGMIVGATVGGMASLLWVERRERSKSISQAGRAVSQ